MMRLAALFGVFGVCAAPATAAPCVSATFDLPFPGAENVTSFVIDVPSSQFPAFWQKGVIDGFEYQIFANATGLLRGSSTEAAWSIDLACDVGAQACDTTAQGSPPENARRTVDALGQCLLGQDVTPKEDVLPKDDVAANPAPQPDPEPQVVAEVEVEQPPVVIQTVTADTTAPQARPVSTVTSGCGLGLVNEATDVATMQRLLVMLGTDPGPVDGFLGPATFRAMDEFVEDSGWDTSIPDLIATLDAAHCARNE